MRKSKLAIQGVVKFLFGLLFVGVLLFLPAGGLQYVNGWLFIALLFAPILLLGIVMLIKSPELLEKRLNAKEKENTQKGVAAISGLIFLAGFVVAGLDHRFGWSQMPAGVTVASSVPTCFTSASFLPEVTSTADRRLPLATLEIAVAPAG